MAKGFFMGIPTMNVPTAKEARVDHYGAGTYVTYVEDTAKEDYDAYLELVEESGFTKHSDNGEGLDNAVFCSTYTKDDMVLTVSYYSHERKTNISFYQDFPLSEHLIYQDSYVEGNVEGAMTKLHMLELRRLGNSFVFQLKNGHFVISDGGMPYDLVYLLDYLENLTPEGEKPIIEAWVLSHAHGDHCGAFNAFSDLPEHASRVAIEGIYFSEPSWRVLDRCAGGANAVIGKMKIAQKVVKTSQGETTPIYRPQTGQRYYFNDITMDILITQEQVPLEKYKRDINTSSTVCLFTVEGQKCFFSGDIHEEGLDFIRENYSQEYLTLDFFTLNHHGFNTSISFTDYITVKTLLLTVQNQLPVRKIRETKYFISKVSETMNWGDGTKVITFPYALGEYETLPCNEWKYHQDEERILQMNIYTFPGRRLKGFIFNADESVFDGTELKPGVAKLLAYLKENEVQMAAYSLDTTDALTEKLEKAGIRNYYELVMGGDVLSAEDPYTDATRKVEACFQLDNVHKYVVVCGSDPVVEAAVQEGIRTIVVKDGKDIGAKLEEKCWKHMDSLEEIYDLFEKSRILFE
jgi:beta-phosphoglucomutase-like phosphatase (HAD superfamily)